MKTVEIVKSLRKNEMLSKVIPPWAHVTIPYPFVRNGLKCLGFYFYQLKNADGKHRIMAPIIQVLVTYPGAKIVSISTSPFFLQPGMNPKAELGFYPGFGLQGKSLSESDAAYAAYYAACDECLHEGKKDNWLRNLEIVKEDGMKSYYDLFSNCSNQVSVNSDPLTVKAAKQIERPIAGCPEFSPSIIRLNRKVGDFLADKMFGRQLKEFVFLNQNYERADYRIAIIGEFSRGKSTFLNRLIGRDILPVGDLPTTAVLTRIRKGSHEQMSFIDKDKSVSRSELSVENLEKYLADDGGHDPEGVLDLQVDLPWLSSDDVVFYDTPGAGDLVGKRAAIVLDAINSCDYTVMTISARAACSMTELQFLRDNVLLKSVPQIAVAVTKLDTIPEDERDKVVEFIRQKITVVAPMAKFFLLDELAGVEHASFDAIGVDAVRASIVSAFASEKAVAIAREQQYIRRVSILLGEARKEIEVVAAAGAMSKQEQREAIRKLESAKTEIDIMRQDLSTACIAAKLEAQKQVSSLIDEAEIRMKKEMEVSVQHAGDIRKWLDVDYPHIAEKAFETTGMKLETWMNKRIANDKSVFAATASKRLSVRNLNIGLPSFDARSDDFDINTDVKDLDKWRTGAKIATIGTMVLLSGLGPGVIIASGVGGILTDRFLKASIEKQRADALDAISAKVQTVHSNLKDQVLEYLENCYGNIAKVLDHETRYAVDNAIAKIKAAQSQVSNVDTPSRAKSEKLKALLAEVQAFIK